MISSSPDAQRCRPSAKTSPFYSREGTEASCGVSGGTKTNVSVSRAGPTFANHAIT